MCYWVDISWFIFYRMWSYWNNSWLQMVLQSLYLSRLVSNYLFYTLCYIADWMSNDPYTASPSFWWILVEGHLLWCFLLEYSLMQRFHPVCYCVNGYMCYFPLILLVRATIFNHWWKWCHKTCIVVLEICMKQNERLLIALEKAKEVGRYLASIHQIRAPVWFFRKKVF